MKRQLGTGEKDAGTCVTVAPAGTLRDRENEIRSLIARHAYQLFEARGRQHGQDLEDWLAAECELLGPCRYNLEESADEIVCAVDLPGAFTADRLSVEVDAYRVTVDGEKDVVTTVADSNGTHTEARPQRVFRIVPLPAEVDPSKAKAILKDGTLVVAVPKSGSCCEGERPLRERRGVDHAHHEEDSLVKPFESAKYQRMS